MMSKIGSRVARSQTPPASHGQRIGGAEKVSIPFLYAADYPRDSKRYNDLFASFHVPEVDISLQNVREVQASELGQREVPMN